jgi:hypothetical protein
MPKKESPACRLGFSDLYIQYNGLSETHTPNVCY